MSLFNRRKTLCALMALPLIASCGFEPIYKEDNAASKLNGQITVEAGTGRENFVMRERFIERFGFASQPKYALIYTYSVSASGLGVSSSSSVTRYNLNGTSSFRLVNEATGQTEYSGTVKATTAYSATSETYPTRVARQDARDRLALALADKAILLISANANQLAQ